MDICKTCNRFYEENQFRGICVVDYKKKVLPPDTKACEKYEPTFQRGKEDVEGKRESCSD